MSNNENNKRSVARLKKLFSKYFLKQGVQFNSDIADMLNSTHWETHLSNFGVVHYDKTKLSMHKADFEMELKHASIFANMGFCIYLPKENHDIQFFKSADAIIEGVVFELKYVTGTRATAGKAYGRALEQSANVAIFIASCAPNEQGEYISKFEGTAKMSCHQKGILVIYFERAKKLIVRDMSVFNKN